MTTVDGFKRVARDITNLCELQMQLLSIDGKLAASRALVAIAAFGLALVISLAAFTSLLIAGGWALHEFCQVRLSIGLLLSGVFGLLFALLFSAVGYQFAKQASMALAETRGELAANIIWMKSLLTSDAEPVSANHQSTTSRDRFSRSFTE